MKTTHTSLPFAGHTLHFVEFDPANFCEQDLLWLPHYAQLQHAGRKRKTEHLAGRIAAVYALREYGYKCVPAIGELRQPVWTRALPPYPPPSRQLSHRTPRPTHPAPLSTPPNTPKQHQPANDPTQH
ncbi:enterobactin synthase subunit EntD, partial [Ligilactobacillus salivarius]|nr:enterobactin synthase subunit EntD [Ligilactobacillus salivarius]